MKQLTIAHLCAEVGRAGGMLPREVDAVNRALRDALIVPRSGRSQAPEPQVDVVHGAAVILACLGLDGVPQIDLGRFVKTIWHNMTYGPVERYQDYITRPDLLPRCEPHEAISFGRVVEQLIEATITPDRAQREAFEAKSVRLTIYHSWMRADLWLNDRTEIFEARPGTPSRGRGVELTSGQFITSRFCGLPVFRTVGDIVSYNRAEAKKQGAKIETATAYSALGETPPRRQSNSVSRAGENRMTA